MDVLTLLASPRGDGNTQAILSRVESALREEGRKIDRIDLTKLRIGGCRSCVACAESADEPGCVQMDDAQGVFAKMLAADAILFATPLYMWSYAGQLKPLLDRTLCLARKYGTAEHRSFVEGKPTALLVACGGGIENNADAIQIAFPRLADYLKLDDRGVWIFPNCTDAKRLPNTHGNQARELAGALMGQ
jgi:multimeric flavodoxin WrbA